MLLLILDDVDTELYRLLAAKAVQVNKTDKKATKNWQKPNGTMTLAMSVDAL